MGSMFNRAAFMLQWCNSLENEMSKSNLFNLHPFTIKSVLSGKKRYESMCKSYDNKGSPNFSIHRKAVEGQNYPYHGHLVR